MSNMLFLRIDLILIRVKFFLCLLFKKNNIGMIYFDLLFLQSIVG